MPFRQRVRDYFGGYRNQYFCEPTSEPLSFSSPSTTSSSSNAKQRSSKDRPIPDVDPHGSEVASPRADAPGMATAINSSTAPSRPINEPTNSPNDTSRRSNDVLSTPAPTTFVGPSFFPASQPIFTGTVTMNEYLKSDLAVLQRLEAKALPATIHNSSYRTYSPRCKEDTRRTLRDGMVEWGTDPNRKHKMRWYMGTAAIGKSALAQSVTEAFVKEGRLGATFFFSRPGKLDDPDAVIPTLVYQLAASDSGYRRHIAESLEHNPLILDMDRSTQFREFIIKPFQALSEDSPAQMPMLIVLDGLDECRDKQAQCELMRLIGGVESAKLPLLWMICSRPEWHLTRLLSNTHDPLPCERIEISAEDEEAKDDAKRLLHAGLDEIRQAYDLPDTWPPPEQVESITDRAAGHLGLISFMVAFMKVSDDGWNPGEKFDLCVQVVTGSEVNPGALNPVAALDRLYLEILSKVPPRILPTTMRILGLSILYSGHQLSALDLANFLSLEFAPLAHALQPLHSIVNVPNSRDASEKPIRLYHASFSDFLRDGGRSDNFYLDEGAIHYAIAIQSLRWLASHDTDSSDTCSNFARENAWNACLETPEADIPDLITELGLFDFRKLHESVHVTFGNFLRWLFTTPEARSRDLIKLINTPPEPCVHALSFTSFSQPEMAVAFLDVFVSEDSGLQRGASNATLYFLLGINSQTHFQLAIAVKGQQ